jgi:hypothetical protein
MWRYCVVNEIYDYYPDRNCQEDVDAYCNRKNPQVTMNSVGRIIPESQIHQ